MECILVSVYILKKYKSVDEIPEGSQIAVMNDATNEDVSFKNFGRGRTYKIS